jgi:hypothetical protein
MTNIYILQLENNKYYIGKTENPYFRLNEHFSSFGSEWTNKYKPIYVIELLLNCDDFDEDKYTLIYMKKYGIDNVRGGSFCKLKLSDSEIKHIQKMINSATSKCYNCGNFGHYIADCSEIDYDLDDSDDEIGYDSDDEIDYDNEISKN